jgi:hypothetical protein
MPQLPLGMPTTGYCLNELSTENVVGNNSRELPPPFALMRPSAHLDCCGVAFPKCNTDD